MDQIRTFSDYIASANRIAVLTGAGISTPSGIPDFRSAGGLYSQAENINVFDIREFDRSPEHFYRFAQSFYPMVASAEPNVAHEIIASWEREGKDVRVATQNIDDLHKRAGSSHVYYLHGNVATCTCTRCGVGFRSAEFEDTVERGEIPRCGCGGVIKPDITFFGELLPEEDWQSAVGAMTQTDLVVIVGTSLVVFPAASLPSYRAPTSRLVIVNRDATHLDQEADLVIHDDLAEVFAALKKL